MHSINSQIKHQPKRKIKDPVFKPETNQPIIKCVIKTNKIAGPQPKVSTTTTVQKVQSGQTVLAGNPSKKRVPPTPTERDIPVKRINMLKESEPAGDTSTNVEETINGDNNSNPLQVPTPNGEEFSPELQKLHELLKADMEQMLIKPLEDRMS